jgi:hypothetical protein
MPLIQCPDCESEVSSLAPACPRCARPLQASIPPVIPDLPARCCPRCKCQDVRKLSLIYQMGSSQGSFGGAGVGVSPGGLGAGVFSGSKQDQTIAARMAAPPQEPRGSGVLALCGLTLFFVFLCVERLIGGVFLWTMLTFTVVLVVGATFAVMNYWGRLKNHPRLYKAWSETWRCLQCGSHFVPDAGHVANQPPIME